MSEPGTVQLTIASDPRSLPIVRSAAGRMAELEGFSDLDTHALVLAIDEALANVIKHGYQGQRDQPITITLSMVRNPDGRRGMSVTVRDQGRQVDPETIHGRDLDDIRPGGLGVHIIKMVMDEYDYSCPPDGGMLLRMVKYTAPQAVPAGKERLVAGQKGQED